MNTTIATASSRPAEETGEGTDWGWGSNTGSSNYTVPLSANVTAYGAEPNVVEGDSLYLNIYALSGTYVKFSLEDVSAVFGSRYDNGESLWGGGHLIRAQH